MGYSKGRAASASLRTKNSILPPTKKEAGDLSAIAHAQDEPDTTLPPAAYIARYGVPRVGTEMWMLCRRLGCFEGEEQGESEEVEIGERDGDGLGGVELVDVGREEAEEEFVLTF